MVACGAWLVGKATNIKFRGSVKEVKVVSDALLASKNLHEEFKNPDATVQSIVEKLEQKNITSREFEQVLGFKFPL